MTADPFGPVPAKDTEAQVDTVPKHRRLATAAAVLAALTLAGCAGSAPPAETKGAEPEHHAVKGSASSGDLRVDGAWIPEPAMPDMSTAYLKVGNNAESDDALVDAETSASADTDLCSTPETGSGAAQMRVVDEIPVLGGGSTELRSGGFHLMVNDITEPLTVGDTVTVTLTFDSGTTVDVEAPVLERTSGGDTDNTAGDHSGHH